MTGTFQNLANQCRVREVAPSQTHKWSPIVVVKRTGGAALAAAFLGVLGAVAVAADRDWWARS